MGAAQSIKKVNFDDVQYSLKKDNYILINTMDKNDQDLLISGTVPYNKEESLINDNLKTTSIHIILYDKNACENRPLERYNQLLKLGFMNVYIYPGGIFEWLLLQDIYGSDNFPTTRNEMDILKYKSNNVLNIRMLRDIE